MEGVAMKFSRIRFISLALVLMGGWLPLAAQSEVIFEEDFDDLDDWTSSRYTDKTYQAVWFGDLLPGEWDSHYQAGYYDPPSAHDSLEILAKNSDKARGSIGKSAVNWREHHINNNYPNEWKSNSALGIYLDKFGDGFEQLYVEFWISFDQNWTSSQASSKVFRVFSWDEVGEFWQGFQGGAQGPVLFWDYAFSENYGVRNKLAFRGGPHGENYTMTDDDVGGLPRGLNGLGDLSANFTDDLKGATSEGDAVMYDILSGSPLQSSGTISHQQIFGPHGTWTKLAFFVKMNSSPGVQDGVFRQWINDNLVIESDKVKWVGENPENKMVKWNVVAIGGNDYWINGGYSNSEQREEWYAIDDIVISTEELASGAAQKGSAPNPPVSVTIK